MIARESVSMGAGPAYFDASRDAWVLGRYADVRAALIEPQLVVHGTPSNVAGDVLDGDAISLVPELPTHWRSVAQQDAERMVDALPRAEAVDLVAQYFTPWSLAVAQRVIGVSHEASEHCLPLARTVFLEAAQAVDGAPTADATGAVAALAALLHRGTTVPFRATTVQAWVALTQSLPATLAGMWSALLAHPEQIAYLRAAVRHTTAADVMTRAVSELLRFAGPAQAVFRTAHASVAIGGAEIRANDRVILLLHAANRDTSHIPDAHRLDVTRKLTPHMALGAGPHRCPGASLVRTTTAIATEVLVRRTPDIAHDRTRVDSWIGGFAIRAPSTVWATISSRGNEETPAGGC